MPDRDPFRFDGQVVLITGGTRGIGFAAARMFGLRGAKLVISSRKSEACEEAEKKLALEGIECRALPLHAGAPESAGLLVEEAVRRFGRLDIAIANAATNPVFDPLAELDEELWSKIIETNTTGVLRLAKEVFPELEKTKGAMVVVSSINAVVGVPGAGAYGVSKAAAEQLVRQLAVEWGKSGVRVNAVAPGTTRTDMIRALAADHDFVRDVEARTPMARLGQPEDVASAILFFASTAAGHITGQVLRVDGGELIARGLS